MYKTMSSILDHVEQSVPRATVYGAMKGSPVFIGKYFREINPSSNSQEYNYKGGERKITFIVASPDKTIFHDLRSAYLKLRIKDITTTAGATQSGKVSEPGTNLFERIVIKMNGTVVEDISRFDYLTSFFKNKLLKRSEKNARQREGYDYVISDGICATTAAGVLPFADLVAGSDKASQSGSWRVENSGMKDSEFTLKLDMSGIMNVQQLLSGYYSPLEIELYLQDPMISCEILTTGNVTEDIQITAPRLCIDQVVMSPEYVSAFESALLANSNSQGIQIPFSTYYTYNTDIQSNDATFWIRKPVRYLRSIFWGATLMGPSLNSNYIFYRQAPVIARNAVSAATNGNGNSNVVKDIDDIHTWQVAIGTKSYRAIEEGKIGADITKQYYNESQVFFAKAVGHYNDYSTETDELKQSISRIKNAVQGIDLEFAPDNDVLASETTLNSNDIRLRIQKTQTAVGGKARIMVFLNYQASIALFPGNETRLLVT